MQRGERAALLGHEKHAGRIAVETMDQLEKTRLGAHRAQGLDRAMGDTAAPVHCEAGGLVEREQRFVLVNHRHLEMGRGRCLFALGQAQRRNPDVIARRDSMRSLDATAVHAHFPAPQHAVDMALRHALEARHEKVVDALSGLFLGHVYPAHGGRAAKNRFAIARHAAYTISG